MATKKCPFWVYEASQVDIINKEKGWSDEASILEKLLSIRIFYIQSTTEMKQLFTVRPVRIMYNI